MRKLLIGVLIFVAITVLGQSPSACANLVLNPGFESDFTSWSQWNENNTSIYNWGHTGVKSAAGWWATSGWQDVSIADPNASTKVGGWLYDDVAANQSMRNGLYGLIRVEFKNASDAVLGTWTTGNLTGADLTDNAWNEKTAMVTPSSYGADVSKATLAWEVNNTGAGSGRGIFDDLMVDAQPIPEPASLLLLGSGLVGLLGLRKRTAK